MKYVVYSIVCLAFVALLYLTCFVWQWHGWLSYVGHFLVIIALFFLFFYAFVELVIYFNRETIWNMMRNTVFAPIQVLIEMSMNPFWWFSENREETFQRRLHELTDD